MPSAELLSTLNDNVKELLDKELSEEEILSLINLSAETDLTDLEDLSSLTDEQVESVNDRLSDKITEIDLDENDDDEDDDEDEEEDEEED